MDLVEFYLSEVLPRLTMDVYARRVPRWVTRRGNRWRTACPIHKGKGPNFVVNTETFQWFCFSKCQRGGGPLEFINGSETPRGEEFVRCVAELATDVGLELPCSSKSVRVRNASRVADVLDRHPKKPKYPPEEEIRKLWFETSISITEDEDASRRVTSWNLDPGIIADRNLARVLPQRGALPRWATYGGQSWSIIYRIIIPLFDSQGNLRSFAARPIHSLPSEYPKSCAPIGFARTGLVMADGLGRQLLARGVLPEWWSPGAPLRLVISEGEKDFLVWSTRSGDSDEFAFACFGIMSGSWTTEIAKRIPMGTIVISRTHYDDAGERYWTQIRESLSHRYIVKRSKKMESAHGT